MMRPTPKRRFQPWEYDILTARDVIARVAVPEIETHGNVRIKNMIACMKEYRETVKLTTNALPGLYPSRIVIEKAWAELLTDSARRLNDRVQKSLNREVS